MSQITCVTVVQWSRSCLNEQINRALLPASRFSVFCFFVPFCFFSCLVSFFRHYFSFWPVFLYSYCWPCWSCTRINNIFWIPEFYFGKGISKALDLHTDQAYDQKKKKKKKNISCQDMSILWNSRFLFSVLVDIMTNNTQYTTNCTRYAQHPPVTHWRNLKLPFEHRLNHQYHYAKISTGSAPKN